MNKLVTAIVLVVFLLVGGTVAQAALVDGLTALWNFEDDPGSPLAINVASPVETLDGTLMGGAAFDTAGKIGAAISLGGGTDFVDVVAPVIANQASAYSWSAWFRTFDASGGGYILESDPNFALSAVVWAGANNVRTHIQGDFNQGGGWQYNDTAIENVDQWHLIAVTYDAALGSVEGGSVYIDGAFTGNVDVVGGGGGIVPLVSTEGLNIGSARGPGGGGIAGLLDEVAIWDRALTGEELTALYNGGDGVDMGADLPPVIHLPAIPKLTSFAGFEVGRDGTAFSSGDFVDGGGTWLTTGINNGGTVPLHGETWIASTADPASFGITLAEPTTVSHIGWKNQFPGRSAGRYEAEYTTDGAEWHSIGMVVHGDDQSIGVLEFDPVENVSGVRLSVTGAAAEISIAEMQVFDAANPNNLTVRPMGSSFVVGGMEVGSSGTAFSSGDLVDGGGTWPADSLNDGDYTPLHVGTWLADTPAGAQFGINLAGPSTVSQVAWKNPFGGRAAGSYELQYTTDGAQWDTVGTIIHPDDLHYGVYQFDAIENVTGLRFDVIGSTLDIAVTEMQVFDDTNPHNLTKLANAVGVNVGVAGTAFSSGDLAGWGETANLNDGNTVPDATGTWIANTMSQSQFGIMLAEPTTVGQIAWKNPFGDREAGAYELQYTTAAVPVEEDWATIGRVVNTGELAHGGYAFDPIAVVTGLRVNVGGTLVELAVSEFEIFLNPNNLEIVERGGALESGLTEGEIDVALSVNGAEAFAESQVLSGAYPPSGINDGMYGEPNAWVGEDGDVDSFVGVVLSGATTIDRIAFSEDNDISGDGPNPYGRTPDTVELQVTSDDPAAVLADPATANWTSLGAVVLYDTNDQLRKLVQFDPVSGVTAARMVLAGNASGLPSSPLMDEFEAYAVGMTWDGSDNDYNTGHWTGATPGGGEAMSIGSGLVTLASNFAEMNPASSLQISGGQLAVGDTHTLNVNAVVDVGPDGTLDLQDGTLNVAQLTSEGALLVQTGAVNVATLSSTGTLELLGGSVNAGAMTVGGTATVGAGSTIAAAESLTVDTNLDLTGSTLTTAGASVVVSAEKTLTVENELAASSLAISGAVDAGGGTNVAGSVRVEDGASLDTTTLSTGTLRLTGSAALTTSAESDLTAAALSISDASSINVAGSSLTVDVSSSPGVPVAGLTALWNFEDGAGSPTAANVASPLGTLDGTLIAGAGFDDAGKIGAAIRLGGGPDYVDVDAEVIADQAPYYTWAAWFRTNTPDDGGYIIESHPNFSISAAVGAGSGGNVRTHIEGAPGNAVNWNYADNVIENIDQWHLMVVTYADELTDDVAGSVYVDGVFRSNVSTIGGGGDITPLASTSGLHIGNDRGTSWEPGGGLNGLIDEVAIWDRMLTITEIESLYNGGEGIDLTTALAEQPEWGNLFVAAGAVFANAGNLPISFRSITGSGLVSSNVYVRETLSPGASAGTLTVTGELELDDDATFVVEIDGDQHDQLVLEGDGIQFSGTAYLAGTLDVQGIGPMTAAGTPTWGDKTLTVMSRVGESNGAFGDFEVVPTSYGAAGTLPLDGDYLGAGIWFGNEGSDGIEYVGRAVPEDAASAIEIGVFQAAPGDTDGNRKVEGQDILNILQAGLFGDGVTTEANWGNGDFNADSKISGEDILALLGTGLFGDGTYPDSAAAAAGADVKLVVTGNGLVIDTAGATVTGFVLSSEAGILTGDSADNLGLFQEDTDDTISGAFAMSLKGEHGLGDVIGETDADLAGDLSLAYTLAGQPGVFTASVVVPEPGTLMLLLGGLASLLIWRRRK